MTKFKLAKRNNWIAWLYSQKESQCWESSKDWLKSSCD